MNRTVQDVTVYLVDDDRGMVSATSQWLTLSGCKVRAFVDPTAFVRVIKPSEQCVVVSDIRMPGINGLELMKLIHARSREVPVILVTGHGDIPLAVEAMKLGAYEFLQKPFSPEKLLDTIEKACAGLRSKACETPEQGDTPVAKQLEDPADVAGVGADLAGQVDVFERELIERCLKRHKGAMTKVMEELNLPRRTLNAKMKKFGLQRADFR